MQMLFAAGMLVDGYVTARLLHWLLGVLTVIWAVIIAQRFMRDNSGGTSVGVWSALILATTPAFTWLMTVTYVDLGLTFVGLAALHFFLEWVFDRNSAALPLSGLMLGCALTMKMQGIALAGVILFVAAIWAVRQRRGGRQWAVAAAVTLVVGGPWYLKSYLITGDPFYPFAYEVFGGKMWSREQANFYEHHQMAFGYGELPPAEQMQYMSLLEKRFIGPRQPYKWLIGPALLTVRPWDFTVNKRLVIQSFLIEWVGPLYLPLILLLLVWKRPPAIGLIMWLFLPLWLWWFFSMQYTRYLVPALVLLAPVAAFPLSRLLSRAGPVRAAAGTLTAVWAVLSLFQLALNISIAWPAITGQVSWDRYLTVTADVYEPSKYIARYLPQGAVIATYGEPRYYYFQRPAIWADPGHSRLFVYEAMQGPADLIARYRQLGVTHVLINRIYAKGLEGSADWVMTLLREGIKSGLLQPMGSFTHQPQYLLLRVADPRPSPPDAGRPATSG